MGDFGIINAYWGFDEPHPDDETKYKHSEWIVYFTFIVFLMGTVLLSTIFINFIIAVISQSY